jgi:hypothetical protein
MPSAAGVFGMSGRGVDDPHSVVGVVDGVAYASAAGDLVLPLFELAAVVPLGCEVSAKAMLSFVV